MARLLTVVTYLDFLEFCLQNLNSLEFRLQKQHALTISFYLLFLWFAQFDFLSFYWCSIYLEDDYSLESTKMKKKVLSTLHCSFSFRQAQANT